MLNRATKGNVAKIILQKNIIVNKAALNCLIEKQIIFLIIWNQMYCPKNNHFGMEDKQTATICWNLNPCNFFEWMWEETTLWDYEK